MDCLSGWVNKTMQKLYFATPILVLGPLNGVKMATNMAKWGEGDTKCSILKAMMHMKYYNFINILSDRKDK